MRTLLIISIVFFNSIKVVKSQKVIYSLGLNNSFSFNKVTGGIEINSWKKKKENNEFSPLFTLQINYGLLGNKTYSEKNVTIENNSIIINSNQEMPFGAFSEILNYYTYFEKVHLIGGNVLLIREFKINNNFYFGLGAGGSIAKDNGYVIWINPFINDTIRKNTNIEFYTLSILSNIGYHFHINKNWIIKPSLQFHYFIPFMGRSRVFLPTSMPNVGVKQDLSISINYLIH